MLSFEESIDFVGEITSDPRHPKTIRLARNSADFDTPRREFHKEENDKPFQTCERPHFNCEEVARHDLLPVPIEELFPRCLAAPFRSGLDAAPFQNIGDRVVRQHMSQIAQSSLDPAITPTAVFCRHPQNQSSNFLTCW